MSDTTRLGKPRMSTRQVTLDPVTLDRLDRISTSGVPGGLSGAIRWSVEQAVKMVEAANESGQTESP
jgi:hypothetical protein